MTDENSIPGIFSQDNWPTDIPYWLFNGTFKLPIGCEVCGNVLRYRPGRPLTGPRAEQYYCPSCGWPDERASLAVPIPAAFLE